jgi:hypothetical protein
MSRWRLRQILISRQLLRGFSMADGKVLHVPRSFETFRSLRGRTIGKEKLSTAWSRAPRVLHGTRRADEIQPDGIDGIMKSSGCAKRETKDESLGERCLGMDWRTAHRVGHCREVASEHPD